MACSGGDVKIWVTGGPEHIRDRSFGYVKIIRQLTGGMNDRFHKAGDIVRCDHVGDTRAAYCWGHGSYTYFELGVDAVVDGDCEQLLSEESADVDEFERLKMKLRR